MHIYAQFVAYCTLPQPPYANGPPAIMRCVRLACTMRQPIRARHIASALPTPRNAPAHPRPARRRCVRLPAQCISPPHGQVFIGKPSSPPRRHNITQSHHDSALSQTYNTANSQYQCRTYAGSHRRRSASQRPPYPRSPISLKPGSVQSLCALSLCPAGWMQRARPAHGMACPNNLLHRDTFGVKIK